MDYRDQPTHQNIWFWFDADDEDRVYISSYICLLARKHRGVVDKIGITTDGSRFRVSVMFDTPESGEWALADLRQDIRRDEPMDAALCERLALEDPGLVLGNEFYNRILATPPDEPRPPVEPIVRRPYVEPDESPTGPLRPFKAIVWREGRHPPEERVSILATSLIQARRLLREKYPGDTILSTRNEEDSNKPRV